MVKRRGWVLGLVGTVLLVAGCQVWPSPRYDNGNTGFNSQESALSSATIANVGFWWSAPVGGLSTPSFSAPTVANDLVYVHAAGAVKAYSEVPGPGCQTGGIVQCPPTWVGVTHVGWATPGSVVVADGIAVAGAADPNLTSTTQTSLYVFDALGQQGCTGSAPRTCQPLWTADGFTRSSVVIAGGVVYSAGIDGSLRAFDATGVTNCAGTPKVCTPLWSSTDIGPTAAEATPAVVNGWAYVTTTRNGTVAAFDVGPSGCGATPSVRCAPAWTAQIDSLGESPGAPVVVDGRLFVASNPAGPEGLDIWVWPAQPDGHCDLSAKTCTPLWRTHLPSTTTTMLVANLAVAYGSVFATVPESAAPSFARRYRTVALDVTGAGCDTVSLTCPVQWQTDLHTGASPIVANGLLLTGGTLTGVNAYDAHGLQRCAGVPRECTPVANPGGGGTTASPNSDLDGISVADGRLFHFDMVGTYPNLTGRLVAYR